MSATRNCTRCSSGTETCIVHPNFYTCDYCDKPRSTCTTAAEPHADILTWDESKAFTVAVGAIGRFWNTHWRDILEAMGVVDALELVAESCDSGVRFYKLFGGKKYLAEGWYDQYRKRKKASEVSQGGSWSFTLNGTTSSGSLP